MDVLILGGFLLLLVLALLALGTRLGPGHAITLGTTDSVLLLQWSQLRLSPREQAYHAAIFGRSGSGKSKLLQSLFVQHLKLGQGVAILEPHHDLSLETLAYLVQHNFFDRPNAYEKLLYLDWGNGAYVPFNVLATPGEPHTVALNALDAMLRVWPELAEAPLFQTLFLSSTMTLIANKLPLTSLYQLLTEQPFRSACLSQVTDPLVHQTIATYEQLGRDQPQAAGSTLRRAFLLSFSPLARLTLGQPDNVLDFRRIMDEGRAIIINLGNVGDSETRKLLGALLMVQIEQAALSRSDLVPEQRTPFTLSVDEWPAFAAQERTISHILSQTRKYNLRLYLAAQSLAQVDSARLVGALENCKLQIAFGLGRDSAVTQSHHLASVDPLAVKERALTSTQHTSFLSIQEQYEQWAQQLQNLEPRAAYVKLEGRPAVKIRTLDVPNPRPDPDQLAEVLAAYKTRYQRTQDEAERAIASMVLPGNSAPVTATGSVAPSATRTKRVSKLPKA